MNECLKAKVDFVKGLSNAVGNKVSGVESVDYVVFANVNNENWTSEYLVIHYRGGAYQARCCSGNSNAAILEELAGMMYSSQSNRLGYNDTKYYDDLVEKCGESADPKYRQKILTY